MIKNKKVVLLGEASVGKTSLIYRLIKNNFNPRYESTIGSAYNCLDLHGTKIDLWDTAGQERYLSLSPIYYRGAQVVLLIFDLNNLQTVERSYYYLNRLIYEIKNDYKCIIVGNKSDLISGSRLEYLMEDVRNKFKDHESHLSRELDFIFISAKDDSNIRELKEKIYKYCNEVEVPKEQEEKDINIINLKEEDEKEKNNIISDWIPSCNCL